MYITTSGDVIAILTREGKQLMSDNSALFKITKFKFSDDGIDYSLFDGSSADAPNTDILNTPVLEPCSNTDGNAAQRFELLTLNYGTVNLAYISFSYRDQLIPDRDITAEGNFLLLPNTQKSININLKTINGYDSIYYLTSSDPNIFTISNDYVSTRKDRDISQMLKNQSEANISIFLKGYGKATLTVVGSDSRSIFKKDIIVEVL